MPRQDKAGERSNETILRCPAVCTKTGLPKSSLYCLIAAGQFPKPVKLSERRAGWVASEVEAWLQARVAAREARPVLRRRLER